MTHARRRTLAPVRLAADRTTDRAPRRRRGLVPMAAAPVALALLVTSSASPAAGDAPTRAAAPPVAALAVPAPLAEALIPPARHTPSSVTYILQPGDTVSHVAVRYGVSTAAVAAVNDLADADRVRSGVALVIPAPTPGNAPASLPRRLRSSPARLAYMPTFAHWADANGIPADLLMAMTWFESGWQQEQVSSTGAVGIGQLMPDTVDFMEQLIGQDLDVHVADDNIRMSARYLRWLLARFDSTADAVAAYYQGPASVARNGTYAETEQYVAGVLALRARF